MRRALASGEVRPLLEYTSWLLDVLDPRNEAEGVPSLEEMVGRLFAVRTQESSALLTAMAALGRDDDLRRRVADEVRGRGHVFPRWLAELHRAEAADRAVQVTEPLQDGTELLVGVTIPGDSPLSVAVFLDNNLAGAVKGALLAPRTVDLAAEEMRAAAEDPDLVLSDVSPADARAQILEGIQAGEMFVPPLQSETWPARRPLLEWVASLLPAGGTGRVEREWSDEELEAVVAGFFASSSGQRWSRRDVGPLVEEIAFNATEDAARDPLLISPVWAEISLVNSLPHMNAAAGLEPDVVLDVFRDFIRFGHAERGIREGLTEETLGAVDRFTGRFREAWEASAE